jgi:homoserine O-acetyltransferase
MTNRSASIDPQVFDIRLPSIDLEAGGTVAPHLVRGWWWGPASDVPVLAARTRLATSEAMQRTAGRVVRRSSRELEDVPGLAAGTRSPGLDASVPTILVVHALTGDMRVGGPGGWWEPLVGAGRALDPTTGRILCFNNLGSCYGTSGPADEGFPTLAGPPLLPAALTTWDQARSILMALDALGVDRVQLATGGSLGAMIVLCLAALAPERFERIAPIAGSETASAWVIGWNHVARQALLLDPNYPDAPHRGLEIARQLAMLTYRAEPGLDERQGRAMVGGPGWVPPALYRIETYLEHQGQKLRDRFHALAYLAQLGAMNHHDLGREPGSGRTNGAWGHDRIRARTLAVSIDTDQLYLPEQTRRLSVRLRERTLSVEEVTINSPHGHDAFLIEWEQVDAILRRALVI